MMHISLTTEKEDDKTQICNIGIALSSPLRVAILSQLKEGEKSITELAKLNYVSVSSILFHLRLLENAGLVNIVSVENNNRIRRYASISCFTISMIFNSENKPEDEYKIYKSSQRVGEYVNANFGTKSGLITTSEAFLLYDNKPFIPERINAELVYTNYGFVEYAFNNDFKSSVIKDIRFSLEICSETPYYNNDFKSDIVFSINGIEILNYTSPGDFGGRRGLYSPSFWSISSSQFGKLLNIVIDEYGVSLNGEKVNDKININKLNADKNNRILFKIESKKNAINCGGFNIFGKNFGDYPQDIEMVIRYN